MAALDERPLDATQAVRLSAYHELEDEKRRKRIAEEQALRIQEDQNIRAQAAARIAQAEEERRVKEAALKTAMPLAAADLMQWTQEPAYQKPWHELRGTDGAPHELKAHILNAYGPEVYAQAPELLHQAVTSATGKPPPIPGLDDIQEGETVHVGPTGDFQRTFTKKPPTVSSTGIVFKNAEEAERAGYNPEGADVLDDGSIRITKLARNDLSRRKLGVNEKNALTGAVTSAATLGDIEAQYEALLKKGKVGPVAGRIQAGKQYLGIGDREFSEFSAQAGGNLFNLAKSLQGAGVLTEQDIIRMEAIVPTGKMDRDQFHGQLAGVRSLMLEKLKAWRIVNNNAMDEPQREQVNAIINSLEKKGTRPATPAATPSAKKTGKEIIERGGKRYEVDHDTRGVKELP